MSFREEVMKAMVDKGYEVIISVPYDKRFDAQVRELGVEIVDTEIDRRGINPFTDIALIKRYCKMMKEILLVQSFTFCASSYPITYLGATPVFVDSEPETWNMDPVLLEEAIKDRIAKTDRKPKAIVPVALYGMPYDCEKIMEVAN